MAISPSSKQEILNQLLQRRAGVTIADLMASVGLSRTAVIQHLTTLEGEGFVEKTQSRKTAGRPQYVYVLTEEGANRFPKQYSWFSKLLVKVLRDQMGEEQVSDYMFNLGMTLSADLIPRLVCKTRTERISEIVKIMNETGFVAQLAPPEGTDTLPRVECKNCVYHDLSKDYPEVCRFDIGFLSGLTGAEIEHQVCMQRGGDACRFRFSFP